MKSFGRSKHKKSTDTPQKGKIGSLKRLVGVTSKKSYNSRKRDSTNVSNGGWGSNGFQSQGSNLAYGASGGGNPWDVPSNDPWKPPKKKKMKKSKKKKFGNLQPKVPKS